MRPPPPPAPRKKPAASARVVSGRDGRLVAPPDQPSSFCDRSTWLGVRQEEDYADGEDVVAPSCRHSSRTACAGFAAIPHNSVAALVLAAAAAILVVIIVIWRDRKVNGEPGARGGWRPGTGVKAAKRAAGLCPLLRESWVWRPVYYKLPGILRKSPRRNGGGGSVCRCDCSCNRTFPPLALMNAEGAAPHCTLFPTPFQTRRRWRLFSPQRPRRCSRGEGDESIRPCGVDMYLVTLGRAGGEVTMARQRDWTAR